MTSSEPSAAPEARPLPTWPPPAGVLPAGVEAEDLLLRLTDLPAGYMLGDDAGCGPWIGTEGTDDAVDMFLCGMWPGACVRDFEQYTDTRPSDQPPVVTSGLLVFDDDVEGRLGFDFGAELIGSLMSAEGWVDDPEPPELGDAARRLATDKAAARYGPTRAAAVIVLSGNLVHWVAVVGLDDPSAGADWATRLAEQQLERASRPTVTQPDEVDDLEVPLDRPNLGVPVYWLGRTYDPRGALPALQLLDAWGPLAPENGPGWRVELEYVPVGERVVGVKIGIFSLDDWERFVATELGRAVWSHPCSEREEIVVDAGTARIFGGYVQPAVPGAACPDQDPDTFVAHVFAPDAVIAVNQPHYLGWTKSDSGSVGSWHAPYDTRQGVEAIVRGLRLR